MKILFFTDNFPPEVNAPASRTVEHCRRWVALGHQVTVITCAPNFPTGKVFAGYRNRLWQREEMNGISVIRVWSYIAPNEGFFRRIVDYMSYMAMAILIAPLAGKPDIIVGTSPQLFTACAAWFTGLWRRVPYVFELRDLWPESIKTVGAMKQSFIIDWLERLELFLYRRAAMVVAVTHSFKRNLMLRGIGGDRIQVITNGVDMTSFTPRAKDSDLEQRHGLHGHFVAGYIGTHGMAHALETLVDAAVLLKADPRGQNIKMLFVGGGAAKAAIVTLTEEKSLGNVVFVDSVAKSEVVNYWALLDCAVIHLKNTPLFQTVIPSKIFESMAMGVPILLGVAGEAAEIVLSYDAGLTFVPEDAADLAEKLIALASQPMLCDKLSAHGIIAARAFDRTSLADAMVALLQSAATA